jgi:conjugal transfer mating pair stabilization protein TraN
LGVAVDRLLSQIVSIFLSVLQLWVPAALLYLTAPRLAYAQADPFMDAARQGQSFGQGILPNASGLAGQDPNGNIQLNWQGNTTTFDPKQLFPDTKNTTDPGAQGTYGSHAAVVNQGHSEVQAMGSSTSQTGDAFRALQNSVNRARVDMSNSYIWLQTDQALADALNNASNSNCEPVTTVDPSNNNIHTPDYRTCERIIYPGETCRCQHDYQINLIDTFGVSASCTTDDDCHMGIDLKVPKIISVWGAHGVSNPRVTTAPVNFDEICSPASEGINIIKSAIGNNTYYYGVEKTPTCENNLIAGVYVHNTPGSHAWETVTASCQFKLYNLVDKGWSCDPGCEVFLTNVDGDNFVKPHPNCTTQEVCEDVLTGIDLNTGLPIYEYQCHEETNCTNPFSCTFGPSNNCVTIAGANICQDDLISANPFASKSISNLCQEVTIDIGPNTFNDGQMGCWTDPQGVEHCPENPGDLKDTCAVLEQNPACTFVSQDCIKGAKDPASGFCYAYNLVFDCGWDIPAGGTQTTMGYVCNGMLKCMGESCIQGQFDPNNTGFAKAAAALQMAQYAQQDLDCSSAGAAGCVLFQGRQMECKKALGGYIDCCTEPEGVSLVEYINLLTVVNRLASVQWELDGVFPSMFANNPLNGVWSTLSEGKDFFAELFSSAWDNLISESLPDISFSSITDVVSQKLLNAAYEFVDAISPELAEMMFDTFGDVGNFILSSQMQMLVGLIQFAMWIYTLYQLFDILVHIIWQCTQVEFELGAKRQLKVCHYNGSYCQGKILGICIEKRDSYCCYNSPLARILQEQVRKQPQVNRPYGEADSPDCSGLTAVDLQVVNWDLVDLSEWMGLLMLAGKLPTQKEMSIEGLTGAGSPWNFEKTSEPRPNLTERTLERLNFTSEDLEQLRITKELMMWGVGQGQ